MTAPRIKFDVWFFSFFWFSPVIFLECRETSQCIRCLDFSLLELESHQPSKRIDHSEPQDICENPIIKESHLQFNF